MPLFDPNDGTLSGGEMAITRIVSALRADWGRLDGQQQRALIAALETSAQVTEEAEAFVLNQLKKH